MKKLPAGARHRLSSFTASNLISILVVLAVATVTLEATQATKPTEEEKMASELTEMHSPKILEGVRVPPKKDRSQYGRYIGYTFSTIVDAYGTALKAAGDEWSEPRVAATFGYPFHFALKKGAVEHDHNCNIETWLLYDRIDDFGWKTKKFFVGSRDPEQQSRRLPKAREEAWEAVKRGIDSGRPSLVYSPYTDEHNADWGLFVGYDDATKTYAASHVSTDNIYTVPYDGFGGQTFIMNIPLERKEFDSIQHETKTLQRAIEFSNGTRYTVERSQNCCGVDAIGFDAYELWIGALESGDFDANAAGSHAWQLAHTRGLAADYTQEVSEQFGGEAGQSLARASTLYREESNLCRDLLEICQGWKGGDATPEQVKTASGLLAAALEKEREAVGYLEEALRALDQ